MYLKSLKLVGFKSFADRTRLEFRSGVTVVVGPNGSGKSNLVDALSWVMGTQANKALRTGKMEDVVFAGTSTRPALSRAEATLIIDNAERMLPLDLDEVSLTRRLYRDGSSDYEINGVGCRLLDIQELLSDSGIGRHQHIIIGQGQVDKVLNSSPEDHRAIIEEAAGILKHRRRKERAERRLERTDEDLIRLRDLVGEIERQMRPLKRQARAAERYDGLKAEVESLTLYISGQALEKLDRQHEEAAAEQEQLRTALRDDETAIGQMTDSLRSLTEQTSSLGGELERDTAAGARLETTMERLRRIGSVAHERSRAVLGRREASVERRADLEEEQSSIGEELGRLRGEEQEAGQTAQTREEHFRRLEDEERAVSTQTSLSPEGAVAAVRGELSVLQAAQVRDGQEAAAVAHRLEVIGGQLLDETTEISRINDEIQEADKTVLTLQTDYAKAKERRTDDQDAWASAEDTLNEAKLEQAAALARVDAVAHALQGRFDQDIRKQLEEAPGALGSLVGLLDVPSGLERAVETALGGWADAVAFGDMGPLQSAVESVKSGGGGGVPVVSAHGEIPAPAREVATTAGVDALVDRLGSRADRGLATRLLGDVLLVEGWKTAWTLVAQHPSLIAVTPEGDLLSVHGVRISHPDGAGPAMLEAAEVTLERAETDLARAQSIHSAAKRDFEKSRSAERSALEMLEAAESTLAGKTEAMARLQQTVNVLEEEVGRLRVRQGSLEDAQVERSGQIEDLKVRLGALQGEEAERMRAWEELESRRTELAASRELARSEWQEAAAVARVRTERRRFLEERLTALSGELARMDTGAPSRAESSSLEMIESFARAAVSTLQSRLEVLRDRQADLRGRHGKALSELEDMREKHDRTRTAISDARERLAHLDTRLTEIRLNRERTIELVRRDADADVSAAIGAPRPDYPEDADLAEMLEEKAAQLRRLGPINPLAQAEFAELSERHQFLADQMADVESSRAELRKVISALDEEIQQRFEAAFTEIASAYQRYFSILFPGGRGRIRLSDPEDEYAGVLIDAQPLGKKVSQLTLLSGGERSLAALAFMFAVFEARPSPFYVLDEVEAALDDTNLRRFLSIVDEFRQRAQLIIVTHQQQTMEAADVLYGVTMEPGGSSQVVHKDMTAMAADQVA